MSILSKIAASGRLAEPTASKGDKITLNDGPAIEAATRWVDGKLKSKEGEGICDGAKADLQPLVLETWLAANAGRAKPESSVNVGGLVLATFASKWAAPEGSTALIPKDLVREKYSFTIEGDLIPPAVADAFVEGILDLAARLGVTEAVKARGAVVPVSEFNVSRFAKLSIDDNRRLEAAGLGTQISYRLK